MPVERIEVRQGDTRTIPHGGGTGGSSSTIISGTTLRRAADVVIQRGRDLAAERLETAPADIAYRDGSFEVVGTDRRIGLFELAAKKPFAGDALFGDKIESFPTGVMVCEVEVDPETGAVRVDRLTAVADCGTVVNPRLLAGQMHGGIVHGLGNALIEEAVYDEATGQLLSALREWTMGARSRKPRPLAQRRWIGRRAETKMQPCFAGSSSPLASLS